MENKFVTLAIVFQVLALILFVTALKGIGSLAAGKIHLPFFVLIIVLAFTFQGLAYILGEKHPKESIEANKILSEPNKNYGIFALFVFIFTIGFFTTFMLEQSLACTILQVIIVLIGIACSFWILRRK